VLLRAAQAYLLRGAPRKAARLYAEVLAAHPNDRGARQWRAAALAEFGRFEQALAELERAEAQDSRHTNRVFRARILFDSGQFEEAAGVLQHGLRQGDNSYARTLLAACCIQRGQLEAARQAAPPSFPSAPWVLARLLTSIEGAIQEPAEAPEPLAEKSAGGRSSVRRGLVLLRSERWREALLAFRGATDAGRPDPRVHFGLGVSLYYVGHNDAARSHLQPVLDQLEEPFHSDALATLGKAALALGDSAEAILNLRRALACGAQTPENYYALGLALLRRGRWFLARKALQSCVSPEFVLERFQRLLRTKDSLPPGQPGI
jgi:Flp pilus assembly protein TadD